MLSLAYVAPPVLRGRGTFLWHPYGRRPLLGASACREQRYGSSSGRQKKREMDKILRMNSSIFSVLIVQRWDVS